MRQSTDLFSDFSGAANPCVRPLRALIRLSSFKKNIATIKKNIANSELIIVVKADAYGHGLVEIAQAAGGASLAVAIPEELRILREAGLDNQVWVLEGPFSLECLAHSDNVIWVIHSFWQVSLIRQAIEQGIVSDLNICIKLDTGMHRLGFVESELSELVDLLEQLSPLILHATMTHFAMSDQADQESVLNQLARFDQLVCSYKLSHIKQTLANSGGVMMYPESHRDWVRPGIMLFSGESSSSDYIALEPVMSFESAIISLRSVKNGEFVGYGAGWVAEKDSIIATVAVGYADGYPRHAPNGTPVAIIGKHDGEIHVASLAGRVSMDMITVDVSLIDHVAIGDKVELWGKTIAVGEVAQLSGTISYELLTSVSKRVPRVYVD